MSDFYSQQLEDDIIKMHNFDVVIKATMTFDRESGDYVIQVGDKSYTYEFGKRTACYKDFEKLQDWVTEHIDPRPYDYKAVLKYIENCSLFLNSLQISVNNVKREVDGYEGFVVISCDELTEKLSDCSMFISRMKADLD